jgi:serine/threonine-protein kinase RsbW
VELLDRPSTATLAHSAWLPRHRNSAGAARRMLRALLADVEDRELYLGVGELVLSELVSNAVVHGRTSPGRLIFVRFELLPGALRVEVHDACAERPTVRRVEGEEESGRGMWLIDQLSVRWGCCPRAGGAGKAVWAIVGPEDGLSSTVRAEVGGS